MKLTSKTLIALSLLVSTSSCDSTSPEDFHLRSLYSVGLAPVVPGLTPRDGFVKARERTINNVPRINSKNGANGP